ncbi:MAG: winged helix-turn-helix transcriptional regulator [Oscillochloris sp.]|nr:winged helix-turn-helix transcriptional regulator [Oscillochloris sp.]
MKTAEPESDDDMVSHLCKALGNPVRMQILRYVINNPGCIGNQILLHMPADGPHAQSTISQHLRVLRDAGLLEGMDDGTAVCYRVNNERLAWLQNRLNELA